jgi:ABC-type spermidine/putrescine transport system permease subunit I
MTPEQEILSMLHRLAIVAAMQFSLTLFCILVVLEKLKQIHKKLNDK